VRHARFVGDADDGRARRSESANVSPRDLEDPRFDGFCGGRWRQVKRVSGGRRAMLT